MRKETKAEVKESIEQFMDCLFDIDEEAQRLARNHPVEVEDNETYMRIYNRIDHLIIEIINDINKIYKASKKLCALEAGE